MTSHLFMNQDCSGSPGQTNSIAQGVCMEGALGVSYKYTCYSANLTSPGSQCFEADFEQYNLPGVQSYGVKGEPALGSQGDLIFSWLDGGLRKMVLTDLQGNVQKTGYVNQGFGPYQIIATWTERPPSRGYTITNFRTCGA
jgi:hypothetical protein